MFCTACGHKNAENNRFCEECGAPLEQSSVNEGIKHSVSNQKEDKIRYKHLNTDKIEIVGIEGMTMSQLRQEVQRGGVFIQYVYTYSFIVMTIKQPSNIFFFKSNESRHGLRYGLINFLFGWWGVPFGPIYTLACTLDSTRGVDLTTDIMAALEESNV